MKTFGTAVIVGLASLFPLVLTAKGTAHVSTMVAPVVSGLEHSPAERITVTTDRPGTCALSQIELDLSASTACSDVVEVAVYKVDNATALDRDSMVARVVPGADGRVVLPLNLELTNDTTHLWVGISTVSPCDLSHRVTVKCKTVKSTRGRVKTMHSPIAHRMGTLIHAKGDSGIVSCRIPGLATAPDGTLLAIYDARYESARDLQGDIDIVMRRSTDGGRTWGPVTRVLDMGCWGGLPQRYNGVSDACILVDDATGRIYVAGLWMHGALDADGKWIEGLDEQSTYWIHQWKGRGSQPGTDVHQTCQFLITHSDDGGLTWSFPHNITDDTKDPSWWLYAPAPGHGIRLTDGTLVFPSQGRDASGVPFSNITYSTDGGRTWVASQPAYSNVTECNAVELHDGTIMLNMRDNRNRGNLSTNGRRVCTTGDLGKTWSEHATSRNALREPTCMASLHRHTGTDGNGNPCDVILFSNPDHHARRINMTLKASLDDGATWDNAHSIIYDQTQGKGYSSITTVNDSTVGVLYESAIADLIFTTFNINELLK